VLLRSTTAFAASISASPLTPTVNEGSPAAITVTLDTPPTDTVTLNFSTTSAHATGGTVIFNAGDTSQNLMINTVADSSYTTDEVVSFSATAVSNDTNYNGGQASFNITIKNTDSATTTPPPSTPPAAGTTLGASSNSSTPTTPSATTTTPPPTDDPAPVDTSAPEFQSVDNLQTKSTPKQAAAATISTVKRPINLPMLVLAITGFLMIVATGIVMYKSKPHKERRFRLFRRKRKQPLAPQQTAPLPQAATPQYAMAPERHYPETASQPHPQYSAQTRPAYNNATRRIAPTRIGVGAG